MTEKLKRKENHEQRKIWLQSKSPESQAGSFGFYYWMMHMYGLRSIAVVTFFLSAWNAEILWWYWLVLCVSWWLTSCSILASYWSCLTSAVSWRLHHCETVHGKYSDVYQLVRC